MFLQYKFLLRASNLIDRYGVYSEVSDIVSLCVTHTINSAKLLAAVVAFRPHARHPFVLRQPTCCHRVTRATSGWKINVWTGLSGRVSNVPLWEEMLAFLEDSFEKIC